MNPHLQCAEQQVSRSNLTKYCACHAERLTYLIIITYETSFTMRGATGVTIQPHQIPRLPHKMTRMLDRRHIWNLLSNAGSNRCHYPTSPNTAPATKNDTARFQRKSPKTGETSFPMRGRSDHDPSMIREWKRKPQPASQPRLLFDLTTSIFYCKIQRFAPNLTFKPSPSTAPATKSDAWTSPSTAPATKSDTWTSPSTAPATKSATWTSPSTAPATKSNTWTSPSTAPATKSDTWTSPSTASATKKDTWTSPSTAPATKSDTWTSPSTAPATKSDTWTSPSTAPATKSDTRTSLLYSTWLYLTLLDTTLLDSTWLYLTLLDSTWLYLTLLYSTLLDSTWLYLTLLDSAWLCLTLLDSTWLYLTLLDSTWLYLTLLYSTLLDSTLLDSTWHYSTWLYLTLTWLGCRSYIGSFSAKLPLIIYNCMGCFVHEKNNLLVFLFVINVIVKIPY